MKNAVKGSLLTPKNGGMLAKTFMVNLEISSGLKQDTMCGNINGMCFKITKGIVELHVLCVETKTIIRSMYYVWKHLTLQNFKMKADI